jgi:hypothetical protein
MKFIHIPGQKSIDLENVKYIYISRWNTQPIIGFSMRGGSQPYWSFKTEEERDEMLEKVLSAAGSQDVSQITTL